MVVDEDEELLHGPRYQGRPRSTLRALVLGMILGAAALASFVLPLPLLTLYPGPTPNVQELVKIEAPKTEARGSFHITTVCVGDQISFMEAMRGWLAPSVAVISRSDFYPPGKTPQQVNREQFAQMEESKLAAAVAALRELGHTVDAYVSVESTQEGTPASNVLQPGDVIEVIDGQPTTTTTQISEAIRSRQIGDPVTLRIRRGDELKDLKLETVSGGGDDPRPVIGVALEQQFKLPFEVTVDSRNIGGPSAGLMFAVGIADQLDPADLTRGQTVAGTGTINEDGIVGKVGGVEQKMIAAERIGARYFLVPKDELAEARRVAPPEMTVIGAATLHDAVEELRKMGEESSGGASRESKPESRQKC